MKLREAVGDRRIWLKSYWGFSPETWGCIGFTKRYARDRFLSEFSKGTSAPGLVAVYVSTTAPRENRHMRRKIVGLLEISGRLGFAEDFIDLDAHPLVRRNLADGQWRFSVGASRAWRIRSDYWPLVDELATESYWPARARHIGSQGVELTAKEAAKLLELPVEPATTFGGRD